MPPHDSPTVRPSRVRLQVVWSTRPLLRVGSAEAGFEMRAVRPAVAVLMGLALALAGCGDDPPAKGCDAAHLDPDGSCTRGSVVGSVQLEEGDQSITTVSLVAETDAGGRDIHLKNGAGSGPFSFGGVEPGTWKLAVAATGYITQSVSVRVGAGKTTDVGTIVLESDANRPASIEGKILLADAPSHGGTLVRLDDSTLMVSTSPDGAFRIGDLTPGAHVLHARHDGYVPLDQTIVLERGPNAVEFTMERLAGEGELSGMVTDSETSAPVEGATVTVGDTWSGTSGPDGRYEVEGILPGIYQVRASRSGYVAAVANGLSIAAESITVRDFALVAGEESSKLHGVATRKHSAEGANGGIEVRLSGTPIVTETDAFGRWRLDEAPNGRHDVVFSDPRFPSVTVRDVLVSDLRHTQVPDVALGPAQKIVDGHSTSSRIFATRRKAVVATTQGTYLYDADRSTRTKLSDEALEVVAVDAAERFATLKGPGELHRLDVVQGGLMRIESKPVTALVSDRALTLFVGGGGDYTLFAIEAGEIEPRVVTKVDGPILSIGGALVEGRGWRVVGSRKDGSVMAMAVDFDGWLGPVGVEVTAGAVPGKVVTTGIPVRQDGAPALRTFYWSDLDARTTTVAATNVAQYGFEPANSMFLLVSTGEIASLSIDTGTVTSLVNDLDLQVVSWFGFKSLVARRNGGQEIHWVSSDPPSSGILCSDSRGELVDSFFACLDGESPHTLRVLDREGLAQTWSEDAMGLPIVDEDYLHLYWNDSAGLLHIRSNGGKKELTIDCAADDMEFSGSNIANCSTQPGSFLLSFSREMVRHLSTSATKCSVASGGRFAVCSHPCAGETCVRLYDFDADTSIDVSTSTSPYFNAVWGPDGGVAIRSGSGAFHATTNGATPQVTSCGLVDATPSQVSKEFSLWFDLAGQAHVCASDGMHSEPFVPWSNGIARIGASHRYFLGGFLVDLADGSVLHLVEAYGHEIPFPGGSLITSGFGLIRIPEAGAPTWLVEDENVLFLGPMVPWAGLLVGDHLAFDLLVTDGAGNVATLLEDGVLLVPFGASTLVFYDEGPDGVSLALIDREANTTLVPYRVADTRANEGRRLFFDTPTDDGLAFATAHLDTFVSSILYPAAGAQPVGADDEDRWIFVADGWTWQESPIAPRAVIAGESRRVASAIAGTIVFHAKAPDATYLLEGE